MASVWKSYAELRKICEHKNVVFWGRSEDWVHKTVRKFAPIPIKYIVDSNPAYKGTNFQDLDVHLPTRLKDENKECLMKMRRKPKETD